MRWQLENFEFHQNTNLLIRSGSEERLEPKTAALLGYFIEHAGKDVSRDALIETVWYGQIVSDSAINRAVVNLRRALGDTEKTKRFIVTVPKVGYRFVGNAHEMREPAVTTTATDLLEKKRTPALRYMTIAALIVLVIGFALNQINEPTPGLSNINVSPLVRLQGVQFGIEQSNNGEMLAFSQRMPDGSAEIHLLGNETSTPEVISLRGGNAALSHWSPDDSQLVYQYYTGETCQLHVVEFHNFEAQAPKTLYECVSAGDLKSLAFSLDQKKLFFTERAHHYAPFVLYELDLQSGSKRRLPQPLPVGLGNYHIDIDPKTGRLLLLSSQTNEQSSVFEIYLADNTYSRLLEMDYELLSAIWSHNGDSIIHPGRHPAHHLVETSFSGSSRVLVPDSRRIGGVKRLNNGHDYLFGTYLSNYNITVNDEDFPGLNSSDMDYIPTYSRDGQKLAFISRRTGHDKLWIKDLDPENLSSIEIPHVSHSFSSIDWSFDDTHVMINSSRGIYLVNILTGETVKSLKTGGSPHAVTWVDASAFTYSQFEENRWQVYRYDLENDKTTTLDTRWAFVLSSKEKQIFIDQEMRLFQGGITEIDNLNCAVPVYDNVLTYRLVGPNLYCIDKTDKTRLRIYENMQASTLLEHPIDVMGYFSIAKGDIASSRFVTKTSDIMRTNIVGTQ